MYYTMKIDRDSALSMFKWALSYSASLLGIVSVLVLGIVSPAYGGIPTVHLYVQAYCYSFDAAPELNCTLSRKEIKVMVDEVNRVWKQAGIRWDLLSVSDKRVSKKDFPPVTGDEDRYEMKERFFAASANDLDDEYIWNIAIVHNFVVPAGGIYFPKTHTVYFSETTPRGNTKPVVLAHELGHSLGLPHSDHAYNLMGLGKPEERTTLTKNQVSTVRIQAIKGPANITDMGGLGGEAARKGGLSDEDAQKKKSNSQRRGKGNSRSDMDPAERRQRMADRLKSFDRDGDGIIYREDVPASKLFERVDTNQDGKIDESELSAFQN